MPLTVGAVLIGQTPRPDYEKYLCQHLPAHTRIHMKGALDQLTLVEIQDLPRNDDDEVLATVSREGVPIAVAAHHIHQRIPALIEELEALDAHFIILLCTGEFPDFQSTTPLLLPSRILTFNAAALSKGNSVSVVVPLPEQCTQLHDRWVDVGIEPSMHAFSPFQKNINMDSLIAKLVQDHSSLVVLDCMGYTDDMKQNVQSKVQRPVMSARSLLGHILEEISF